MILQSLLDALDHNDGQYVMDREADRIRAINFPTAAQAREFAKVCTWDDVFYDALAIDPSRVQVLGTLVTFNWSD